jgi:TRAP-type C4-dicarboxylate transport system permease small subunit
MRSWLKRGAEAIGGGLFVLLFLVFLVQIVARFAFDRPLPWTDELAVVLYVWVILWSTAFVVPQREHVAFDLVYNAMPAGIRRVFRGLAALLFGGLALWALPASWDYIRFMAREGTPVLGLPFMAVFLPFALMLVGVVARSAHALWRIARGLDHELSGEVKA